MCLEVFAPMVATMTVLEDNLLAAAKRGFINATDLADYLTKKGVPFRAAYKTVGEVVAYCIDHGKVIEDMTLPEFKEFSEVFDEDLYSEIDLKRCVAKRISAGGCGATSVDTQIKYLEEFISD